MLDLHSASPLERRLVAILAKIERVPEPEGILHTELRGRIEGWLGGGAAAEVEEAPTHLRAAGGVLLAGQGAGHGEDRP